ncbi:MAG: hypothetical protein HYU31_20305 [Deltaproteobacteria bacterium]|nr:hypothetical protein [Deltaproteobacteria bacterium]
MANLKLSLAGLTGADDASSTQLGYNLKTLRQQSWDWDRVVKSSHLTNCWYQRACNFNLYVKDGVVLREEQVGNYPPPNDPEAPDPNPRGCQKGACYAHRMYDPTRIKYPLKRVGERGGRRSSTVRRARGSAPTLFLTRWDRLAQLPTWKSAMITRAPLLPWARSCLPTRRTTGSTPT